MDKFLNRFWIEFEIGNLDWPKIGITAYSIDDAMIIIQDQFKIDVSELKTEKIIEGININDLDQNHVIPNIGAVSIRGIWYPKI